MIEGEATLYTDFASAHAHGFSEDEVDLERAFAAYRHRSQEVLAIDEDPILSLYSHFAYAFGGDYVLHAFREGGHARVGELFRDPPDTQRELMFGPNREPIVGVPWYETDLSERAIPVLSGELSHATTRQLGAFGVLALHRRAAREPGAQPLVPSPYLSLEVVRDVETDVLSVLFDEERTVVTWRIRLESAARAKELRAQLTAHLYARDDGSRRLRRRVIVDDRDVIVAAASPGEALPSDITALEWTRLPESEAEPEAEPARSRGAKLFECALPPGQPAALH